MMATFDSKKTVDKIIAGQYAEDGWIKVVEYINMAGNLAWGAVSECEPRTSWDRYEKETEFIRNPRVIWKRSAKMEENDGH